MSLIPPIGSSLSLSDNRLENERPDIRLLLLTIVFGLIVDSVRGTLFPVRHKASTGVVVQAFHPKGQSPRGLTRHRGSDWVSTLTGLDLPND